MLSIWRVYAKIPNHINYGVTISNTNNIIYFMDNNNLEQGDCQFIFNYNKIHNKWDPLISLPPQDYFSSWRKKWNIYNHYLGVNIAFDRMYINLGINGVLVINLETEKIVKIPVNHCDFHSSVVVKRSKCIYHPFSINKAHIICHLSGEIHFISCWIHVKWIPHNIKNTHQSFEIIHDLRNLIDWQYYNGILDTQIIYVPSQNILFMIGGHDPSPNIDFSVGVWKYEFANNSWSKIKDLGCNLYGHSALLTSDQNHIIIGGGFEIEGESETISNAIWILNIHPEKAKYVWRKSIVSSPFPDKLYHVQSTGGVKDKLLVTGWIRKIFKNNAFNGVPFPPLYLMEWMSRFYDEETIHCLLIDSANNRKKISVDHVGLSLYNLLIS